MVVDMVVHAHWGPERNMTGCRVYEMYNTKGDIMKDGDNPSVLRMMSIVTRASIRFFDQELKEMNLGGGQQFFLVRIAENEGIRMHSLAALGHYDKATVTKAVSKLAAEGYVEVRADEDDRRAKRLYTTEKGREILRKVSPARDKWMKQVTAGISEEDMEIIYRGVVKMVENATRRSETESEDYTEKTEI